METIYGLDGNRGDRTSKVTGSDPKVKGGKKDTKLGDSRDSRDKSGQRYL